jgi:hypothetical protein
MVVMRPEFPPREFALVQAPVASACTGDRLVAELRAAFQSLFQCLAELEDLLAHTHPDVGPLGGHFGRGPPAEILHY